MNLSGREGSGLIYKNIHILYPCNYLLCSLFFFNRSPVLVAEFLNGERHWQSLNNYTNNEVSLRDRSNICKWYFIYRGAWPIRNITLTERYYVFLTCHVLSNERPSIVVTDLDQYHAKLLRYLRFKVFR